MATDCSDAQGGPDLSSMAEPLRAPSEAIDALVEAALDDIETGNLGVRGALRTVAKLAWGEGRAARR